MRPVLHGDVSCAARALLGVAVPHRKAACARLINGAQIADEQCLETGRIHAEWGNGSLIAAARRYKLPPEPTFDDDDYCACVAIVLHTLIEWRVSQRRS